MNEEKPKNQKTEKLKNGKTKELKNIKTEKPKDRKTDIFRFREFPVYKEVRAFRKEYNNRDVLSQALLECRLNFQ